jgi:hypothetical protein
MQLDSKQTVSGNTGAIHKTEKISSEIETKNRSSAIPLHE